MARIGLSYWLVLFLALWGCRKDVEQFAPYTPSAQDLSIWLAEQVPSPSTHSTFTLNSLTTDKVLETPNGTRIFLIDTDNLFSEPSTGLPVPCSSCPDLKVEVTEVLDKSDIVARGLNTIDDDGILFESAGMVRVTVTCNGQQLALLPDRNLKIQLPVSSTQSGFFVYSQAISPTERWSNSNQEVFEAVWPTSNGNSYTGYELLVKKLGWSACGRLLTDSSSPFCIELPSGFADQNTLAYLIFKHQNIVVPLQYDLGQNKFCHSSVPAGFQVKLMTVSKLGERFWLGKADTEVGTNTTFNMSTQEISKDAVLNFVKGL